MVLLPLLMYIDVFYNIINVGRIFLFLVFLSSTTPSISFFSTQFLTIQHNDSIITVDTTEAVIGNKKVFPITGLVKVLNFQLML